MKKEELLQTDVDLVKKLARSLKEKDIVTFDSLFKKLEEVGISSFKEMCSMRLVPNAKMN